MSEDQSIVLRDANEADIRALSELHVRTFRETHGGGPTAAVREQQWLSKFASGQLVFCVVLENPLGDLIGFASGELYESEELSEYRGELNKIYLLREFQGRSLGRRLLCAAAGRFLDHDVSSMLLFGDARSPSNGFYEAMRGVRLYGSNGEFHGAYGWPDLPILTTMCSDWSRAPQA